MNWLQIEFAASADTASDLEELLENQGAVSVTMTDAHDQPVYEPGPGETPLWHEVTVTGLFPGDTSSEQLVLDLAADYLPETLPEFTTSMLEDQNWQRAWIDSFHPMRFGQHLWICPSWSDPPAPEDVNILLDPGLAFGTGTHPTTALCLEWLDSYPPTGETLVDYGCGSGILGIAALLLDARHVIGVDNDAQALTATRDNCERNGIIPEQFPVLLPDDFRAHMAEQGPVDGVLANILAEPLVDLAGEIAELTRPGGWILLSGILETQSAMIMDCYSQWFDLDPPASQDGWTRISGRRKVHRDD